MIFYKIVLCVFVLFVGWSSSGDLPNNLHIELVQVLFRHGERTLQRDEAKLMTKADNILQEPWGFAQLTNTGKQQEYRLGKMLRQRYGSFLGRSYRPQHVYACSSDYDRTKNSLQLALAALYPPTPELIWNEDLRWQPIPIHFVPKELDVLFNLSACPKYQKALRELMASKEVRREVARYEDLFQFLRKLYPSIDFNLEQLFYLNNFLIIQRTMNISMPAWYSVQAQGRIAAGAKFYLDTLSGSATLNRLNGGSLARRLVENMNIKNASFNSRRLYLYSGHEFTVYALAKAHNVTLDKSPAYGSAIILEKLRDHEGELFVRMFLWTGPTHELVPISLGDCEEYCPISDYLNLVRPSFPSDDEMRCLYEDLRPTDLERILTSDTTAISL